MALKSDAQGIPRRTLLKATDGLIADKTLVYPEAPRSGFVEVMLTDNKVMKYFTKYSPETKKPRWAPRP
jgi:hypothetical protein